MSISLSLLDDDGLSLFSINGRDAAISVLGLGDISLSLVDDDGLSLMSINSWVQATITVLGSGARYRKKVDPVLYLIRDWLKAKVKMNE